MKLFLSHAKRDAIGLQAAKVLKEYFDNLCTALPSERRLLNEVRMHLAYRWFAHLDLNAKIPDHSTFSKNRHGRFRQSGVF